MKSKKYELEYGGQFLKDLKLAKRRGLDLKDLSDVTDLLQEGKALPEKCRDHVLTGNYKGYRECHINPDWLLLWEQHDDQLVLLMLNTGTHSDIYGKIRR